jgi:hypothetical protein
MAKAQTAARPTTAAPPGATTSPRSNSLMWIQGLLCGGMVALLPSTSLLLGALLGPAMVALYLDPQPGKPVARSVLLCTLAACVRPVGALWSAGRGMAASVALATDPNTIGTAWSAAAAGWFLAELIPVGIRIVLEVLSLSQMARLRTTRAALIEAWGLDIHPD